MEKDFVEYVAKSLVDEPEKVVVSEIVGRMSVILELSVAPDDIGKIIGKGGRIARSIRLLLGAIASKTGKRITLHILD